MQTSRTLILVGAAVVFAGCFSAASEDGGQGGGTATGGGSATGGGGSATGGGGSATGGGGAATGGGSATGGGGAATGGGGSATGGGGAATGGGTGTGGGDADAGACSPSCGQGRLCCNGECVNPDNDPFNCGNCGVKCDGATPYCAGSCQPQPCSLGGNACDNDGGLCCGSTCCAPGQLCCQDEGPVSGFSVCFTPDAGETTCPQGCSPLCQSDVAIKQDIEPTDEQKVLERVAAMKFASFDDRTGPHVGAQLHDSIDAHGTSLAAIKALYQRLEAQQQRIDRLEAEHAALEKQAKERSCQP